MCDPWDEGRADASRSAHSLEERVRPRMGHALGELIEFLYHHIANARLSPGMGTCQGLPYSAIHVQSSNILHPTDQRTQTALISDGARQENYQDRQSLRHNVVRDPSWQLLARSLGYSPTYQAYHCHLRQTRQVRSVSVCGLGGSATLEGVC